MSEDVISIMSLVGPKLEVCGILSYKLLLSIILDVLGFAILPSHPTF